MVAVVTCAIQILICVHALLLAGVASAAASQAAPWPAAQALANDPQPPGPAPPQGGDPGDRALYAAPTRIDRIGRILAPVMINGLGPFRLLVDTGANQSTVSPALAAALGLVPLADSSIQVNGITGTGQLPAVRIERLQIGDLEIRNVRVPVVGASVMQGGDGILGVAGLRNERIQVDFRDDRVTISRSHRQGAAANFLIVPAQRVEGGLLSIIVRIAGIRVQAIIDTGAERTLGNPSLYEALRVRPHGAKLPLATTVYGATADISQGLVASSPPIDLGPATISHASIVFGDFNIFRVWDLQSAPALVIGMDVLGTLRSLIIDYRASELYLASSERPAGFGRSVD